ncbi:DUF551 domain-containing protein [Cronobacter sakazakii]|nr:DUF551 domain-containing protein [Cronobacter sakazakii]EMC4264280.1 DUF551 domain-containing protein [Cronobacter sakazakii]HEO1581066.1 DUF551 domain-containing protein [Cronobacter sakazakii]HEO1585466.1 DUF551 domain-containing protein [Cronobacter sakazakii]
MLLAGMDSEPVAFIVKSPLGHVAYRTISADDAEYIKRKGYTCEPLYAAPPAPVSVPDEMEMDDDFDSAFEHGKAVGWNACRAAMLQGAEPVSSAYKLPDGWIKCSERMPVDGNGVLVWSETGSGYAVEAYLDGEWYRTLTDEPEYNVTHWMPLPAAPGKEG